MGINERLTDGARGDFRWTGWRLAIRLRVCGWIGHAWRSGLQHGSTYCARCALHEGWIEHGHDHPLVEAFWDRGLEAITN